MSSRKPTVTIKDIARKVGMSHPTVSRALNDNPRTSDATKAIVRQAAADMGYVPHAAARAMRQVHSRVVGLVIPLIQTELYHTVAKVLTEQAHQAGYQLVLALSEDDPAREFEQIRTLIEARAAGIIVAPSPAPLSRTTALLENTTFVQLNRFSPKFRCDAVGFDDLAGTKAATMHLIELGHRQIALIGRRTDSSTGEGRLRGYQDALRDAGIAFNSELTRIGSPRTSFGLESMLSLLDAKERPTAVLCTSSELTVGALDAVRRRGIVIPDQLSLIGYTDPVWYQLVVPALTTISLPVEALAEMTAALLFREIDRSTASNKGPSRAPTRVTLTPDLIIRASTARIQS